MSLTPAALLLAPLVEPGDRLALAFGADALTYRELARITATLASRLAGSGPVAVWATPSLATCVAITAALAAGVPVVPLNPKIGQRELEHVIRDAAPAAVLAAPGVELPPALAALARIDVRLDAGGPAPRLPRPEPEPERAGLVVYTSGTTGPPKGAVLSRAALAANLDGLADAWAWTADDVLAHALPLFHVHGLVLGVLGVLRRGATLQHLGTFDAASLGAAITGGATMVFGVPTHYHRLAAELPGDPTAAAAVGRARLLVSGSAALTTVDHTRIAEHTGQQIRERYGMTETLIITAARADEQARPGTVGRPLRDTQVRVTASNDKIGDGEIGDVEVRGPGLFSGYLNRADTTAASYTADGWFQTGDIGRFRPDSGELELLGRRGTDLIKSGGYKIGAGEIENALLEHPEVAEAAVIGVADTDLGERVVAWVVPADLDHRPAEAELVDHVASLLSPHKRPREVRFVAELPRNDLGKIVKSKLPR